MGHPMRLELTLAGLLVKLANHYTTRGARDDNHYTTGNSTLRAITSRLVLVILCQEIKRLRSLRVHSFVCIDIKNISEEVELFKK